MSVIVLARKNGMQSKVTLADGTELSGVRRLRVEMPGLDDDMVMHSEIYCDRCEISGAAGRYPFADLVGIAKALGCEIDPGEMAFSGATALVVSGWLGNSRGDLRAESRPGSGVPPLVLPFTSARVEILTSGPVTVQLRYVDHPGVVPHVVHRTTFERIANAMGCYLRSAA